MAKFNPPFSDSGDYRYPSSDERQNGFACGPADRELFNGLFHQLFAELKSVTDEAGLTTNDTRDDWVLQAIQALISAATGGNPAGYVLMDQARARLPIFPEVNTASGIISVTSPASGQVRLPDGITFVHRGIFNITTTETDFATSANKIYHMRWNPDDGFTLKDLSDAAYNAGGLSESNKAFDSVYDDMLIARIVTNSSNLPTITNLANKNVLALTDILTGTNGVLASQQGANWIFNKTLNWARSPTSYVVTPSKIRVAVGMDDTDFNIFDTGQVRQPNSELRDTPTSIPLTRYNLSCIVEYDFASEIHVQFTARA